jgi:uncharacterized damage-inducible protein DinB
MHLRSVLRGAHSYLAPQATLAGLAPDIAVRTPAGTEHSIAEIVLHMAFWQEWFLDRCDGVSTPAPARADAGWPAAASTSWDAILERFNAGFNRALQLADDDTRTPLTISPPLEFDHLAKYTQGDALIHLALHNAHHLGQVITLRQQMDAWPPPAGSWTW